MAGNKYAWSTTAATNASADSTINWAEGQAPSTVNDSARAMMAVEAAFLADNDAVLTTGGSANAQTVTMNLTPPALATGLKLRLKAGFTNTGAATLTVTPNGAAAFAAKAILGSGGSALAGGEIVAGGIYDFNYDAAAAAAAGAWVLVGEETNPTTQVFTSGTGTYTTPAGVKWIDVKLVGAGGGGGSGNADSAAGGNTTFGTALLVANGGALGGPSATPTGGAGGSASGGTINIPGGGGGGGVAGLNGTFGSPGGKGGDSFFGGGGVSGYSAAGGAGATNSGGGGSGGGNNSGATTISGAGGGAGGFCHSIIKAPSATYAYAVGAGGAAGTSAGAILAGGAGAAGLIVVTEYYGP